MKLRVLNSFKASRKIRAKDSILEGEELDSILSFFSLEFLLRERLVEVLEDVVQVDPSSLDQSQGPIPEMVKVEADDEGPVKADEEFFKDECPLEEDRPKKKKGKK